MEFFDAAGAQEFVVARRRRREDSCASMGISVDGSDAGRAYSPPPRRVPIAPPNPEALDNLRCMPVGMSNSLATAISRQRMPRCLSDEFRARQADDKDSDADSDPNAEEPRRDSGLALMRLRSFATSQPHARARSRSRERTAPDCDAVCDMCTRTDNTMKLALRFIISSCIDKFLSIDTICMETARLISGRDAEACLRVRCITPGDVAVHMRTHMTHAAVVVFVLITDNLNVVANLAATSAKHVTGNGAAVYDFEVLKKMHEASALMLKLLRTRPSDCAATELPPVENTTPVTPFAKRIH